MSSNPMGGRKAVLAAVQRLETGVECVIGLGTEALSELDRVEVLCRLAALARKLAAHRYDVINRLVEQATATDIGGPLVSVLADRLSLTPAGARRMIGEAADVGARRALTGAPLAPRSSTPTATGRCIWPHPDRQPRPAHRAARD
jgi:hypothetical protein